MANELMNELFIELHIPDFNVAERFYEILGFEVLWKIPGDYMVMKRHKTIINFYSGSKNVFKHTFFRRYPSDTVRGYAVEIAIPVINIEHMYQNVKNKLGNYSGNGGIVEELKIKPWGKKDFRVIDPFGFYLCITEGVNYLLP